MVARHVVHRCIEQLSAEEREILSDSVPGRSLDERVAAQLDRRERILTRAAPGLQLRAGMGRRAMLKSLGASALLAPFLASSLTRRRVQAQAQASEAEYDNLLIVNWPCGLEPNWTPMGTGNSYQLGDKGPGSTKYGVEPQLTELVAAHRDKMLLVTGAQSLIETDLFAHSQGPCSMWTGSTGGKGAQALSKLPSIEQKIRDKICANLPVKSIHAGTLALYRPGSPSTISLPFYHWAAPETGIEPIDDPGLLYTDLAPLLATAGGSAMGGADAAAMRDRVMRQKKSVIDFVMGEIGSAKGEVSTEDAARLDQHLTKIRELEQRLFGAGKVVSAAGVMCEGGAVPDMALTGPGARLGTNGPALVKAQSEIIGLAFKCGLTKVATLQLGETDCLYQVPYEGATYVLHAASHNMGDSNDPVTRWVSSRYMADRVGQIISTFAGIDLGGGKSLLDKTLIVATSEMSIQEHVTKNIPYVIAGGSTGYFRKGEHIALNPEYRISKLVLNLLEYFGFDDQTLGEAAAVGGNTDAPLTEVRA